MLTKTAIGIALLILNSTYASALSGTLDKANQYPFVFGGQYEVERRVEKFKKGNMLYTRTWTRSDRCTFTFVTPRVAFTSAHCVIHNGKQLKTVNINVGKATIVAKVEAVHPEYLRMLSQYDSIHKKASKITPEARTAMPAAEKVIGHIVTAHDVAVVSTKKDATVQPVATIYKHIDARILSQPNANSEGGYTQEEANVIWQNINRFIKQTNDSKLVVVANGAQSCKLDKVSQWAGNCMNDMQRRFINVTAKPSFRKNGARLILHGDVSPVDKSESMMNGDSGGALLSVPPSLHERPILIGVIQGGELTKSTAQTVSLLYNFNFLAPYLRRDADGNVVAF